MLATAPPKFDATFVAVMPLDVFIHTDGHISQPPSSSGYRASTFWSGQMRDLSEYKKQWDCCYRAPTNVDACFKYESILNVSASSAAGPSWLGLLSDSDVVFQCSAKELKNKFRRFGVPLVVSGERRWYPLPRNLPGPIRPGEWNMEATLQAAAHVPILSKQRSDHGQSIWLRGARNSN